jgi:hypothetical protein
MGHSAGESRSSGAPNATRALMALRYREVPAAHMARLRAIYAEDLELFG